MNIFEPSTLSQNSAPSLQAMGFVLDPSIIETSTLTTCFEYYIICFLGTQNISRWLLAKLGRKTMFSVYSRQSCMQNSQHIASQHLSSKINIKLYSLLCWQRQRPLSINTRKEVMRLTIAMAKANPLKENNSPWIYMSCIQPFWAAIPFSSMRK